MGTRLDKRALSFGGVTKGHDNMLLRILASEDHQFQSDGSLSPLLETFYVPILPKIGVYMNMHALIISSVTTMIVSILTHGPQNYTLVCLIPCFVIGFVCGAMSVVFGFLSLQMRDRSSSAGSRLKHVYVFESFKLLLSASVTLMVISNVIFLAAGGCSVYVVASLFLSR
jgi:hypothetical protein